MKRNFLGGAFFGGLALALFGHLWWRTGEGALSGPFLVHFETYGFVWDFFLITVYFSQHSILASDWIKSKFPSSAASYRRRYLFFNFLSILTTWALWAPLDHASVWVAPLPWRQMLYGVQICGVLGFIWTARSMDLSEFMGLKSAPSKASSTASPELSMSGPYALCRHPTYFFTILLLASPDMSLGRGVLTLASVLYIGIGSILEERKLILEWGAPYEKYRVQTPWLLPTLRSLKRVAYPHSTENS